MPPRSARPLVLGVYPVQHVAECRAPGPWHGVGVHVTGRQSSNRSVIRTIRCVVGEDRCHGLRKIEAAAPQLRMAQRHPHRQGALGGADDVGERQEYRRQGEGPRSSPWRWRCRHPDKQTRPQAAGSRWSDEKETRCRRVRPPGSPVCSRRPRPPHSSVEPGARQPDRPLMRRSACRGTAPHAAC